MPEPTIKRVHGDRKTKNGGRPLLVFSVLNVGGVAAQQQLTKPTVTSASPTIQMQHPVSDV